LLGDRQPNVSEFAAWRRLDRPSSDAALLRPYAGGWLLQGAAAFDHEAGPAGVAYQVEVDAQWETKRGILSGKRLEQLCRLSLNGQSLRSRRRQPRLLSVTISR
jgi:hypothetical protein